MSQAPTVMSFAASARPTQQQQPPQQRIHHSVHHHGTVEVAQTAAGGNNNAGARTCFTCQGLGHTANTCNFTAIDPEFLKPCFCGPIFAARRQQWLDDPNRPRYYPYLVWELQCLFQELRGTEGIELRKSLKRSAERVGRGEDHEQVAWDLLPADLVQRMLDGPDGLLSEERPPKNESQAQNAKAESAQPPKLESQRQSLLPTPDTLQDLLFPDEQPQEGNLPELPSQRDGSEDWRKAVNAKRSSPTVKSEEQDPGTVRRTLYPPARGAPILTQEQPPQVRQVKTESVESVVIVERPRSQQRKRPRDEHPPRDELDVELEKLERMATRVAARRRLANKKKDLRDTLLQHAKAKDREDRDAKQSKRYERKIEDIEREIEEMERELNDQN